MFIRIVTSALIAGFGAGLLAALLHFVFVQPVLLHAELFEADPAYSLDAARIQRGAINLQRELFNAVFLMLIYTGYAFLLLAGMVFAAERGQPISARTGLIWGIAGFVTMQFAPAFSVPPEVPGMIGADLEARQIWWFATAAATAAALWLIAFGRNWAMWGAAIILLAAPHLINVPHPDMLSKTVPAELASAFAARTLGVSLAVWTTLGALASAVWHSKLVGE